MTATSGRCAPTLRTSSSASPACATTRSLAPRACWPAPAAAGRGRRRSPPATGAAAPRTPASAYCPSAGPVGGSRFPLMASSGPSCPLWNAARSKKGARHLGRVLDAAYPFRAGPPRSPPTQPGPAPGKGATTDMRDVLGPPTTLRLTRRPCRRARSNAAASRRMNKRSRRRPRTRQESLGTIGRPPRIDADTIPT